MTDSKKPPSPPPRNSAPPAGATLDDFLDALRAEIISRYAWAQDNTYNTCNTYNNAGPISPVLARFMRSVEDTCTGHKRTWNKDGPAADNAWRAIGGKGKPSYRALEALPRRVAPKISPHE